MIDSILEKKIDHKVLIGLYRSLLVPRMIEEKMLLQLRQGKISKWFSGIGQEAISVGCTAALDEDEMIFTMHRNLGVFTTRKVPLERLFGQWQGNMLGFTKGRDRSFHFGAPEYNIVGMISLLGPQLSLASGVALAHKLRKENKVSLAFTGEGGTSQGEFHEALNVASVWKLPVIFVIENNGYGLSTPTNEQYACTYLAEKAEGYGMKSKTIDGNNILEVYSTIRSIAEEIRESPEPWLVECMTFRMRGHEEASGQKYVPKSLIDDWAAKDPLSNYESFLLENEIIDDKQILSLKEEIKNEINIGLGISGQEEDIIPDTYTELNDIYATYVPQPRTHSEQEKEMRFVDSIAETHDLAMAKYDNLIIMGQDIAEYGGVFKITEGLHEKYGKERVRNTPLCESAIVGISLGLSIKEMKSIVEMQFADFVTCGFNQIINNLAKVHYRWGQHADVVIRMPTGAGVGAGPFHSQSDEAWFFHTPGLKVVYPSSPADAKGLLMSAIEDPNPVMYFEHKALYRKISGMVPEGDYYIPIGKAKVVREGDEVSIVTYGMGVHWATELVDQENVNADIIDLRTLLPLDYDAIDLTVSKTGRVLILHEDCMTGGIGGDISAYISENLFEHLDAPVIRVASLDTPVPFNKGLEDQFLPHKRFKEKLFELLNY